MFIIISATEKTIENQMKEQKILADSRKGSKNNYNNNTRFNYSGSYKGRYQKWCSIHKSQSHNTSECRQNKYSHNYKNNNFKK